MIAPSDPGGRPTALGLKTWASFYSPWIPARDSSTTNTGRTGSSPVIPRTSARADDGTSLLSSLRGVFLVLDHVHLEGEGQRTRPSLLKS